MATISRETLLFREVWLKAAKSPKALRFPTTSPAAAQQLRLKFYNSVKNVRNGTEVNVALEDAISLCSLRVDPEDKATLMIGPRSALDPTLAKMEAMLGVKMSELQSPEEKAAEASLKALEAESQGTRNPYYTRGEL
jgi:hypothetical protein